MGKGGHFAVMSELLLRGWNVAIPEVDIGDDIFVVQDEDGTLRRVQVKTSQATKIQDGFSGQFSLPVKQLKKISNILVHYIFIVRNEKKWTEPIIFRQDYLLDYYENDNIGSEYEGYLNLHFSFQKDNIVCSKIDITKYISDFTDFPIIKH